MTSPSPAPRPERTESSDPLDDLHERIGLLEDQHRRLTRRLAREYSARLAAEAIAEEATRHAVHDPLTGLATRALLEDAVVRGLRRAHRLGLEVGVLFFDLDRFKLINDTHGHAVGDEVLRHVADAIRLRAKGDDLAARLGGDEFALVASRPSGFDWDAAVAGLHRDVRIAHELAGVHSAPGVSIGFALCTDGIDAREALERADAAMYDAKSRRIGWRRFDDELALVVERRRVIRRSLPDAVADGRIQVHLQPIVDLELGDVVLVEALARWFDDGAEPADPVWSPLEFVAIAEESGAIVQLGRHVLESALDALVDLRDASLPHAHPPQLAAPSAVSMGSSLRFGPEVAVSVNVSPIELQRDDFANAVVAALRRRGLVGSALVVEVTESAIAEPGPMMETNLRALRSIGVRVALDDFGTGHSSFDRLRRHAVDLIKIDRSFIWAAVEDERARAVVYAMASMARSFGALVIAEGIETDEQYRLARDAGCSAVQGFRLGRPGTVASLIGRGE